MIDSAAQLSAAPLHRDAAPQWGRWGHGQLLALSALDGPTAMATDLVARTVTGAEGDGFDVVLPARAALRLEGAVARASLTGDRFILTMADGGEVAGAWIDNRHLLVRGRIRIDRVDEGLVAVHRAGDLTLIGTARGFDPGLIATPLPELIAVRDDWQRRMLARLPAAVAAHPMTPKVLAMMKNQVCSAEGILTSRWTTPDRWPHRNAFLWDSAFHALAWRHLDPALALEQLGAVLGVQAPDGFIPHSISPAGGTQITQPPVLAWGAAQVLAVQDDRAWLEWAYPRLTRFLDWLHATRVVEHGLCAWKTTSVVTCRCDESGWDNSPRFDRSPSPLALDLNAFLVREFQVMAGFAARLGRNAEVRRWEARAAELAAAINAHLWNGSIYGDRTPGAAAVDRVRTPAAFLPLVAGIVPPERRAPLVRQLADPAAFGTPMPLPSVAIADLEGLAATGDMWRGPVWININHQVVRGLQRNGETAAAERLRSATLGAIERWYERTGGIFEFYDPADRLSPAAMPRKGRNDPASPYNQVIHDFGWTASCWLDLACAPAG